MSATHVAVIPHMRTSPAYEEEFMKMDYPDVRNGYGMSQPSVTQAWLADLLVDERHFFIDGWENAMTCVEHIKELTSGTVELRQLRVAQTLSCTNHCRPQ